MGLRWNKTSIKEKNAEKLLQKKLSEMPDNVDALKSENKLLRAQNSALINNQSFLEDCLAEMAGIVYAE